ncbi:MAG: chromate resistance protein [Candidatus Rokubacteria bacterium]|nr:chromate resistance protein [Candidatus Rokubacteria bacterium]
MKWVTRERARVDRIACPWLITRFIDPEPVFRFVPAERVAATAEAEGAIPFDVPGVELGHHGDRCSFDAFVERHELDDPALERLGAIVRGADTDRRTLAAESAGLHAAASGFRLIARDDHDNIALQFPLYDALYAHCRDELGPVKPRGVRLAFVCLHGAAKSVLAAALARRLGAERGIDVRAIAAGIEPDAEVSPAAVRGLTADGLDAPAGRPRRATLYDVRSASRVVTFGCDLGRLAPEAAHVDDWPDVPAVSDGYETARDAIRERVDRLIADPTTWHLGRDPGAGTP